MPKYNMTNILNSFFRGVSLACFRPCSKEAFHVSWDALWVVIAFNTLVSVAYQYFDTQPPREFSMNGILGVLSNYGMCFLGAYLTMLPYRSRERLLDYLVIGSYAGVFPTLFYLAGYKLLERYELNSCQTILFIFFLIWLFLVYFRVLYLVTPRHPVRQLAGACIAMCALGGSLYMGEEFYNRLWYHDYSADEQDGLFDTITSEELFQKQYLMMQERLSGLRPAVKGKPEVYAVIFAADANQDVFMREGKRVTKILKERLGMDGRVVTLINNEKTTEAYPLATVSNLSHALFYLGGLVQPKEDMVLLYLTSHGGKDGTLETQLSWQHDVMQLDSGRLKALLKENNIKNRAIIVSACYSGSMMEDLKAPDALVIASAARDRMSFGCSQAARMTVFGEAYFTKALQETSQLDKAFLLARKEVKKIEKEKDFTPHSNPQMFVGEKIKSRLPLYAPNH